MQDEFDEQNERSEQNPEGPTWRCFVGAFLDAPSARRLSGMLVPRLGLRRVDPETWHVTLKFLGAVPVASVPQILAAVESLSGQALKVTVTGFIGLPRAAYARVIAAEIAEDEHLARWAEQLAERFGPEDRPFRPHVTVARSRRPARFRRHELSEPLVVRLEAPGLYRSHLSRDGACYERVTRPHVGAAGSALSND
jgi:2'-5' RNA ligase